MTVSVHAEVSAIARQCHLPRSIPASVEGPPRKTLERFRRRCDCEFDEESSTINCRTPWPVLVRARLLVFANVARLANFRVSNLV
jgi:hypothetical protein